MATNDGWTVVVEESASKVIFDSYGDCFTGVKVGTEVIQMPPDGKGKEQEPFTQFQFRGFGVFDKGTLYGVNESYKLAGIAKIPDGNLVEITYVKDVPVGQGNDMKDYRIRTRPLTATEKKDYGL